MKRFYAFSLTFFLIISAGNLFGQTLSAKYDTSTATGLPSEVELISHNSVTNTGSSAQDYYWVVKDVSTPTAWNIGICDKNDCYFGTDSQEFSLDPMEEGSFDIHFFLNNTAGQGCVTLYVYPKGSYNDGITIVGCAKAGTNSLKDKITLNFNMYPSPVRDVLTLQFGYKGKHKIEVYNILGRKLITKEMENTDRMRVSFERLQNGMYVVMYTNERGKVITKTISKE
jgi:hypothetical protein